MSRATEPQLVIFHSERDGPSRRLRALIAQVLQQRRNHTTFRLTAVAADAHPELFERFSVERIPTLCVVEEKRLQARLEAPRTTREIRDFLGPWLR